MMPVIIFGASGQLGKCLQDELNSKGALLTALSSKDGDITRVESLDKCLSNTKPSVVINCAAYTAVDKAEDEVEQATLVNSQGAYNLASVCKAHGHHLVHISTDYVFDGSANRMYSVDDPTSPLGVYGETKLDGEKRVLDTLPGAIVIRTSWVFSEYGGNFVKTMLRLAMDRNELSVVADQMGKPTYARDLARAICEIIGQIRKSDSKSGIYHFSNEGETNWCEFAKNIFCLSQDLGMLGHGMKVNAIASSEYPTRAQRPNYSVLDNSKIYKDFSIKPRSWQESLLEMLKKLQSQTAV